MTPQASLKPPSRSVEERGRASDRVLKELRRMIITLELPPGAHVTEATLIDLLACSRTPLREALQHLAAEHLVVAVPRRGVTVAELSIVDFSAQLEAIEGTESFLVRLSAERITDEQLARLDSLMDASDAAAAEGALAQVAELDFEFHDLIGTASGNEYLREIQATLHRLSMRFVYLGFNRARSAGDTIADHRRIIAALRSRDPDAAETAVREHCHSGRDRMRAAL
jgi:DNA-binding GntR family transcriptional regulator